MSIVLYTLDAPSYFPFTKVAEFSRLAAFTVEFVKIPPTSTDIVAIKRKFAEERTLVNSRTWGPKGRYREIQSGKSRADRHTRAEGLRNGRSGFMAALNPNERSFPPPPRRISPRPLSIENVVFARLLPLGARFQSFRKIRKDFTARIAQASTFSVGFRQNPWFYDKCTFHYSKSR